MTCLKRAQSDRGEPQIDDLHEEANALRGHLEEAGVFFLLTFVLDANLFCEVPVKRSQWSVAFIRGEQRCSDS